MNISEINSRKYYSISYKGIDRTVYKKVVTPDCQNHLYGNVKHKNTSWMFRGELWFCKKVYSYFSHAFKDVDRVNVYNYGCSVGYEAYSYLLWLLSGKKKNPEKFLPIIAKDYDEFIIKKAKEACLLFDSGELRSVLALVGQNKLNDFFVLGDYDRHITSYGQHLAKPTKKLTGNVKFSVADIRDDYKNINPQNSIVIATNMWPYIEKEERYELAENLYKQLDKGSYIRIDAFDNNHYYLKDDKSTAEILKEVGFKKTAFPGSILKR